MTTSMPAAPQSLDEVDITSTDAFVQNGYPYPHWAYLREHAPVYWYERPGIAPFWAITKYHDIQRISRDPKTFSNDTDITIRADPEEIDQTGSTQTHHLLQMDPPRTRRVPLVGQSPVHAARFEHPRRPYRRNFVRHC